MAKFVGEGALKELIAQIKKALAGKANASHTHSNYVPASRKVNSKALSADITLTAADVKAAAASHTHTAAEVTGLDQRAEASVTSLVSVPGILIMDEANIAEHGGAVPPISGYPHTPVVVSTDTTFENCQGGTTIAVRAYTGDNVSNSGKLFLLATNIHTKLMRLQDPSGTEAFSVSWNGDIAAQNVSAKKITVDSLAVSERANFIQTPNLSGSGKVDINTYREEGLYLFPSKEGKYTNMPSGADGGLLLVTYHSTSASSQQQYFIGAGSQTTFNIWARASYVSCSAQDPSAITAAWSAWKTVTHISA